MANYFVLDNEFRPYSFDELVKPYQMYGQAYKEQEAILGNLEGQAASLEAALSKENDPIAYATYTNYLNQVKQAANDIATKGLNAESRRKARALSSEFNHDILPIQAAFNRRKELQDEQRKALLANPTLYYQRNLNTISPESSLDRFVENPNYDYGDFFSGALLEKQVSDAASSLAKELTNYGPGKKLDRFTNTFMQQHGFTRDQVLSAINNPNSPDAPAVLNAIVESVVGGSGVANWNDENALAAAYNSARRGLFSAVGQTSISPYDNYGAKLAAQRAAQNPSTIQGVPINPINIFGAREQSITRNNIEKYSKYFIQNPDGSYRLSDEGNKEIQKYNKYNTMIAEQREAANRSGERFNESGYNKGFDVDFIDFLNKNTKDNEDYATTWSRYYKENNEDYYDAKQITEYKENYDPSQQDTIKQKVLEAATGTKLQEMDYDANQDKFVKTGNTLSLDELKKPEYKVIGSRISSRGSFIMVQDKNGETLRYHLPSGINQSAEESRDNMLKAADEYRALWQNALDNGTKEEQLDAYTKYNQAVQEAYLYQSQLGLTSEVNPLKYNPYIW